MTLGSLRDFFAFLLLCFVSNVKTPHSAGAWTTDLPMTLPLPILHRSLQRLCRANHHALAFDRLGGFLHSGGGKKPAGHFTTDIFANRCDPDSPRAGELRFTILRGGTDKVL